MGAINLQIDMQEVNAEIERLKAAEDAKANQIAERLRQEGVNWARQLVRKDTGDLDLSIDTASKVTKIAPCIYDITLGNGMDYGAVQELDPKRGRAHIRPGAHVMQLRASGICKEVYEG